MLRPYLKHLVLPSLVALVALLSCIIQDSRQVSADDRCVPGFTMAEADLWADHGCWQEFFLWQYYEYRMHDDDWGDWGFFDACNLNLAYPKAWNASYLITYGLSDNHDLQWHATIDYRCTAEAIESNFHNQIHYEPSTNRTWWGDANTGRFLLEDRTFLGCQLFDANGAGSDPASRASIYIHEGWHHWQHQKGYDTSHLDSGGACMAGNGACDWYYWHTVGAFEFGDMWHYTRDGRLFHSPYQVQAEYLCDVAELSSWWVPSSVRGIARSLANSLLSSRFRNAIGYRCGDPRPW